MRDEKPTIVKLDFSGLLSLWFVLFSIHLGFINHSLKEQTLALESISHKLEVLKK